MIEINNASLYYRKANPVLSNVSLNLAKGHYYGLFGKNGEGKTSLLKMMCGGLNPTGGAINVEHQNMATRNAETFKKITLVPEMVLLPNVNCSVFLKMNAPFYPNFNYSNFHKMLEQFHIPVSGKLSNLSQGQQKKTAIAFGLAAKTPWLLLDEPTNGLDIPSKQQFQTILSEFFNADQGVIISTHQIQDIENLIDQVLILDNQKIVFNYSLEEIENKFLFETTNILKEDHLLYHEKQGMSFNTLQKNVLKIPGTINLALLFNAAINPSINLYK